MAMKKSKERSRPKQEDEAERSSGSSPYAWLALGVVAVVFIVFFVLNL